MRDSDSEHYVGDGCPGGHLPWELPGYSGYEPGAPRRVPDPGMPAVLFLPSGGGGQHYSAHVHIAEPGHYYLHLVRAGDGRVWTVLTPDPSPGTALCSPSRGSET